MSWLFGKKDKLDDGAKGASAASADAAPPKVRLKSISIEQVSPGALTFVPCMSGLGTCPAFCLLWTSIHPTPGLLRRNLSTESRRIRAVWPTIPSRRSLVSAPAAGPSNCEGFRPPFATFSHLDDDLLGVVLCTYSDGDDYAFVAGTASLVQRRHGGTMSPSGSTSSSSSSTRSTDHRIPPASPRIPPH